MSAIRFHHVFAALILIGMISALVLPAQMGKGVFDFLLAPISRPVRSVALSVSDRFSSNKDTVVVDEHNNPLSVAQLREQNQSLRAQITSLFKQIEELQARNADREKIGRVADYCEPYEVVGADTGQRESLSIQGTRGSRLDSLARNMPVFCPYGLAGRIDVASIGGARVQLITDTRFRVTARFVRIVAKDGQEPYVEKLAAPLCAVAGNGHGRLLVTQLSKSSVEEYHLAVGDTLRIEDRDWPPLVQGYPLGTIEQIRESSHLFSEIVIKPDTDLLKLREVMVATKLH